MYICVAVNLPFKTNYCHMCSLCFCKQLFIFIANIIFQNVAQILYGANARAKITEVSHRFTVLHTDKLISRHIQFSMYADRLQSYTVDSIYTVRVHCTVQDCVIEWVYSSSLTANLGLVTLFVLYSQSYLPLLRPPCGEGKGQRFEPGTGGSIGGTLPTRHLSY